MKKLSVVLLTLALTVSYCFCAFAMPNAKTNVLEASLSENSLSAKGAVLINAETKEVYFEKNKDERLGMASTTKLMTALVVLDKRDPSDIVTVGKEAVGIEGSSIYLVEGERLTIGELLCALLLASANDAAVALAIAASGSLNDFVYDMNDRAADMGLTDTCFQNPHGLYHEQHYTTAYELAIIAAEALKNETIAEIVRQKKMTIPLNGNKDERLLVNHNKLLSYYDGAIGMKTGFTKKTGRSLVSAAERNGLTLIAVTLDAPSDWNDHRFMLDYGFDNYECTCLYATNSFIFSLPVSDGNKGEVPVTNSEPIRIFRKKNDQAYKICVEGYTRFAVGTVNAGDIYGSVTIRYNGHEYSSKLVYAENVKGNTTPTVGFFDRIKNFFSVE